MIQLKKITITHIYGFKLLSISLFYFFIFFISFGYTHEFINSFRTKIKKKKLNTCGAN